jgi:hypothetical protein
MVRSTRATLVPNTNTRATLVQDFLASSPAERLAFVDKLAADISDGKKPKSAALDFCANLSRHLRHDGIEKNLKILVNLAQVESFLRDRSPSIKHLLQFVALRA